MFVGCMIIPTGIGCSIGGHSGDANIVARLLSKCVDKLIVHPNVVNASDINEMTDNMLYVEGGMLDHFLDGLIELQEVRKNRIIVFCNEENPDTINAVNAIKYTLGVNCTIKVLSKPLIMNGYIENNKATGTIENIESFLEEISKETTGFDAIAVHTPVDTDREQAVHYCLNGGINPWGGVEAMLSNQIFGRFVRPNAHAPIETMPNFKEVSYPRLAAEMIGGSHLYSVLKGLSKAPVVGQGIKKIDALISPMCFGAPHRICNRHGVPIIYVNENKTTSDSMISAMKLKDVFVRSYFEACGVLLSLKEGISLSSISDDILQNNDK